MNECSLCNPELKPLIATEQYWRLVLNLNQNLLGKCFWVLQRHEEQVVEMTEYEWAELHSNIRRTVEILCRLWRPDHFNMAFLQNQDRHVHFHIIPRYAGRRYVGKHEFDDLDYPSHYAVAGPSIGLPKHYKSPYANEPWTSQDLSELGEMLKDAYTNAR